MSEFSSHVERILLHLYDSDPAECTEHSILTSLSLDPDDWKATLNALLRQGLLAQHDAGTVRLTVPGIHAVKRIAKRPADIDVHGNVGPGAVIGPGAVDAEMISGGHSVKISGGVEGSVIVVAENVMFTREGWWKLTGGDKRLSDSEGVEQTITEIRRTFPAQVQKVADTMHFGPVLLERLLQNYRSSREYREPQPVAEETPLRCYNQTEVMNQIRYRVWQTSSHVVELSGPSGIGKTHVLYALRNEQDRKGMPADQWGVWRYAYLNVAAIPDSFERIMSNFVEALGGDSQISLPQCLARLSEHEGVTRVLFMLDGVEALSDETLLRLAGEEGPVGDRVQKALWLRKIDFRLVVTTRRPRFPQRLTREYKIGGLLPLSMDPLDRTTVGDMLLERVPSGMGPGPNANQAIDQMAQLIYEISGGHPGAIHLILRELADNLFAVPLDEYYRRFQPLVLQIVRRDIIGDLSLKEYHLLNVLCVFRRFHVELIRQLLNVDLLPADLIETVNMPGDVAIRNWLDSFCEVPALIRRDDSDSGQPFAVHPILRHVLALDLATMSPEYLHRLHTEAHQIYDQGVREQDPIHLLMPLVTRPAYTMEALYHYVQSQRVETAAIDKNPAQRLQELAETYWRLFINAYFTNEGIFGKGRDPFALRDRWREDEELQDCIRRLPGGAQAHQAIDALFAQAPEGSLAP